ncbi:hypothetical protein PGTUg99_035872 [Puccinia graminis f. sp. tritici]|uniref:RPA43 OB domain-containing protein n=1 Tax=Puccinia graminis f. sp. tritici TaxID=56615 RepID=A0A5B0RS04_PUCGR|nr:hypothetical protein PGTUg99_035872 [Puccinia graminis f. sp. tritici]
MSHSKPSSSTRKPTDFHHLTARLKLPLAPVFLTKPMSKTTTTIEMKAEEEENVKEEMDDLESDSDESTKDLKKTLAEPDRIDEEYGNSGVLEAINQSLASLMMKYIPSLGSVLVSYLEPPMFILKDSSDGGAQEIRRPATKTSRLPVPTLPGNGWGVVDVEVKLLGWRPTIGQKLVGRPTLSSPSHLSLVIYRTFNASINENHLRAAGFHYDINFEVPAHWKSIVEPANPQDQSLSTNLPLEHHQDRGCWVDANGVVVGDDQGTVSFTVMGLTIANHMISVVGSLLDDPFSIEGPARASQPSPRMTAMKQRLSGPGPVDSESSTDNSEDEGGRSKAASLRGRMKAPPAIQSGTALRPIAVHPHTVAIPTVTPTASSSIQPPPLTATNLKALDSAHLQPSIPVSHPSPISVPSEKSKKTKKKKPLKRPADALEDKPSLARNPSPPLPNQPTNPSAAIPPPLSSTNSSRKKKLKTN